MVLNVGQIPERSPAGLSPATGAVASHAALPSLLADRPADEVGSWYESSLSPTERASIGAFYTPWDVVDRVLDATLGPSPGPLRVCDPACGSGRFLVAAARRMARAGLNIRHAAGLVRGFDADSNAVLIARAALRELGLSEDQARHAVLHADALTDPRVASLAGAFDAVVGNPPFIDSARSQRDTPGRRDGLRALYASARGNFDLSTLFVELGLRLATPHGGLVGLITPLKLLASDAAAAVQSLALAQRVQGFLDLSGARPFDAGVETCVLVVRRSGLPAPDDAHVPRWRIEGDALAETGSATHALLRRMPAGYLLGAWHPEIDRLAALLEDARPIGALAHVADGSTTAEAYALAPLLEECADAEPGPGLVKVINTGLIDPGTLLWGQRPMRFLGRTLQRPVVKLSALERAQPARARQAMAWKVGLAGLSSRLEAAVCPPGVLCAKSVVVVTPASRDGAIALERALNDPAATRLYRALFGGRGFSGRSMTIGARQVERLALPLDAPG